MSKREKYLAIILTLVGVVVVFGGGGYLFIAQPLFDLWEEDGNLEKELAEKESQLAQKQTQEHTILKNHPRLAMWKKISLPPTDPAAKKSNVPPEDQKKRHVANMQLEYEKYLHDLLSKNRFTPDTIKINARPLPPTTTKGKTPPAFERLVFTVTGRGRLEGLLQMLQSFHATNLLQVIRNINVTAVQNRTANGRAATPTGDLDVNLTVEALMVNGAESRSTLLPPASWPRARVLAEPSRSYREMANRHMFLGIAAPASRISEDRREVLRFIRLTTLAYNGRRWEAYIYDQAKGGDEHRVNAITLDEFSVQDKYDNTVLDAKVVQVDERHLILKVDGKLYKLAVGEFILAALNAPLTSAEQEELGLK